MKSRLGFRRAKGLVARASALLSEALYNADFDLNYLKDEATEEDRAFHARLKAAHTATMHLSAGK